VIKTVQRVVVGAAIILALAGCGRTLERIQKTLIYQADHPKAVLRAYTFDSYAMSPMIKPGDAALVDMGSYDTNSPKRGDVVLFVPPAPDIVLQRIAALAPFVKRIVAVGGDRLSITGGWL
jgi:type IV secretory pathway protease TraF